MRLRGTLVLLLGWWAGLRAAVPAYTADLAVADVVIPDRWAYHAEAAYLNAYAQVCWANHTPFLIVRGLSDLAGGQRAPNPINENENAVAVLAAKTVRAIYDQLPP